MDQTALDFKHSDVLYDYIKFHLGLYIATPPLLAIVATALEVATNPYFQKGMIGLIAVYFVAGVNASWTIATYVNVNWTETKTWESFGKVASSGTRRFFHHYLYWIGLILGLSGMLCAKL